MNIKIKYTNIITKIWRNLLKYWQELVMFCQLFASVALTLNFKGLFYTYSHRSLTMLYCEIFLKATLLNQSRTNGPINAHLTIAQV